MANFNGKIKVKTGVDTRNKFDLSCAAYTTTNFFEPRVTYFKEMVPTESISIDMRQFTRLAPMVKPLMGKVDIQNNWYFVPFRCIWPQWNNFLANIPTYVSGSRQDNKVPIVTEQVLIEALCDTTHNPNMAERLYGESVDEYDFLYDGAFYKLLENGRKIYSILQGLGYNIMQNSDKQHGSNEYLTFSALPLLAYTRVYFDYYRNEQLDEAANKLEKFFNNQSAAIQLSLGEVKEIFRVIRYTNYEKDIFNTCNLKPLVRGTLNMDNTLIEEGDMYSYADPVEDTNAIIRDGSYNKNPLISIGNSDFISQYLIDGLKTATDWCVRHNIVGAKNFMRILGDYGVMLDDKEINKSSYLGKMTNEIQFSEVMQNSSADNTVLGDYAGSGQGYGSKHFNYHTDEFGYIMCITTVVPRYSFYQGVQPHTLRKDRLAFFTPEWEHLGQEVIPTRLLYGKDHNPNVLDNKSDSVFGWNSQYATYKAVTNEQISGDFAIRSRNTNMKGWILTREMDYTAIGSQAHPTLEFSSADSSDLNNVFVTDTDLADTFIISNYFVVNAEMPAHKLFDDYEFKDDKDGKSITATVNGNQNS